MDPRSRRRFLATSAALLALPFLGSARTVSSDRRIRLALKYGMIHDGASVLEKFEVAKRCGFDGVEIDAPSDLDLDEVLRARQATGLAVPGVVDSRHWQDTLGDADPAVRARGREALERALRDAKQVGADSVLLVPAVVNASIGYDEAWDRSTAEIRAVLPLAAELQVAIALENVWNHFLLSPLEAARYVDQFASAWIGWHFDVGNVVTYGWPDQWIRVLGKRILKLDVKEYSRKKRDAEGLWKGFEVELLEGDCDWPRVMAALDAIGYGAPAGPDRWMTAEVAGGDASRLRELAERMGKIRGL